MFDSPISLSLKGMRHKLNPLAIVNLASDGDRVCEGDKVRSAMSVSQIPGPSCVIARLLPFSRDVEDALPADWAEVSDVQMRKIRLQPTK
ncbi:hypothetical protein [Novosphingobium sp. 18052]|nr:hypothetical protein [Novosphingobium sp. 18052]